MQIETTIYIHEVTLVRLRLAAAMTGYSCRSIISVLLRRYAEDNTGSSIQWTRVSYQKQDAGNSWRRLHLQLNPDEYEFFLDLRKVFKRSVSACVALAIDMYLDDVVCNMKKDIDNYRYKNYSFARVIIDGVVCWILSWGVPRRPLTQLLL
jgi:hypothetical protein